MIATLFLLAAAAVPQATSPGGGVAATQARADKFRFVLTDEDKAKGVQCRIRAGSGDPVLDVALCATAQGCAPKVLTEEKAAQDKFLQCYRPRMRKVVAGRAAQLATPAGPTAGR